MRSRFWMRNLILIGLTAFMVVISIVSLTSGLKWLNKPFPGFLVYPPPYVASFSTRDWPGKQAGLAYLDRIISVDGQAVGSGKDVLDAARNKKPGTPIRYVVESKGELREFTVPVTTFTFKDFFFVFSPTFIIGITMYILGIIVFLLKPNTFISWVFLVMCLALGIYGITGFECQSTHTFTELNTFALSLFPLCFFHLGMIFPERKRILIRFPVLNYFIYLPALIQMICWQVFFFLFTGASDPSSATWVPYWKLLSSIARFFTLFGFVSLIVLVLYSYFKSLTIQARTRAKMMIFGVAIAFLPVGILMILALALKVYFPFNFIPVFVVFFPIFIGYSIVKHNLFDADTIIRRTVGYAVVTAVVIGAYVGVSLTLNVLMGQSQLAQSRIFPIFFTLGVVLVFNPLRNRIQSFVDRIFFRKEYDYGKIIDKISAAITSLMDLGEILRQLVGTFIDDMFIDTSSVMLMNPSGTGYQVYLAEGEKKRQVEGVNIDHNEPLIEILKEEKRELTKYDMLEDPKYQSVFKICAAQFEALSASLIVPMVFQEKVIGFLNLGEKKSGKIFNREDIDLLNAIANQGAVAIENARMVDEIIEKERIRIKLMDTFGKYVTPEVRDQILAGEIPLDGEAKKVTLLFADLRDFTTLAESTTPKEVVRIINGYFSEMADAIGQNHGLVLQFIGDEIEAVFGAPLPLEDHPTHAVRAALDMQRRLVVVNQKLKDQGYGPLRHGIGIHTGAVVAANIGSQDRLSYAMVGDSVNLASRIQGLNKKFGTTLLISSKTVDLLADNIAVEKLPATTVKGKREPVEVYKLAQTH